MPERLACVLFGLLSTLFGAHARAAESERVPEPPAAFGLPEADPADRFTVRQSRVSNGLDKIVVKVAGVPFGQPTLVELFAPDLTPSSALEVRQAFGQLVWKPALGPNGQPVRTEVTLLFHTQR